MSGQRSRLIRRAVRITVQSPTAESFAALELMRVPGKSIRRAARMTIRKLLKTADKMKASETASLVPRMVHNG